MCENVRPSQTDIEEARGRGGFCKGSLLSWDTIMTICPNLNSCANASVNNFVCPVRPFVIYNLIYSVCNRVQMCSEEFDVAQHFFFRSPLTANAHHWLRLLMPPHSHRPTH